MNEKVEKFLQEKQAEEQEKLKEEMGKTLIEIGLYEKEYSSQSICTEEFSDYEYDPETNSVKFYKKVPIEVSAEEYNEIEKFAPKNINKPTINNAVSTTLLIIGILIYGAGFLAGCIMGDQLGRYGFSLGIAFTCWIISLISGTTFLGFAEIIRLLSDIKNK